MFNAPRNRFASALIVSAAVVGLAVTAHAAPGDVTATVDSPCKYPSGLASDGTHLYVADWREARIFRIDPADGDHRDPHRPADLGQPIQAPRGQGSGLRTGLE